MSKKEEKMAKQEIQIQEKNELRELEQFYATGQIDNLIENIDKAKEIMVKDMVEYAKKNYKPVKWDKEGCPLVYVVNLNSIYINNHFFKPITPITCQEPLYNAEKLSMVYDYYCYLIAEVNDKIGDFPSSLSLFCKFAGITTSTLRKYRDSEDLNMRIVTEKIYDQIGDENLTMSQLGIVKEKSTIFKLKSQHEMVEKVQPKVNINIVEKPNMERINERLNKYKQFAEKKSK